MFHLLHQRVPCVNAVSILLPSLFFNDTATTEIYPLSLHDALPISVNEEISRENPAGMFVTAIVGVIDARTGEVELCNAGHNAPILVRVGAAASQLDGAGGPPLCVDQDFTYASQHVRLAPGEVLLLLTDGAAA